MTRFHLRFLVPAVFAGVLAAASPAAAQMSASELIVRLDRLENQVRQLTGTVEQLQYRNQQLEQMLRKQQEDAEFRAQEQRGGRAAPPRATGPASPPPQAYTPPPQMPPAPPPQSAQQEAYPPPPAGPRRGDAFDPNQSPNAAGVPRTLGAPGTVAAAPPLDSEEPDEPNVGAPGGRRAGAPLDLATMSEEAASEPPPRGPVRTIPGALPAPPPRNPSATGTQMVMAPSNSPKDEYDLAYGYILRKDYALAEESLRAFVKKHPSDRLVADANYWLGESLFQRQRYREAAEAFLAVSTKFESSGKAPDSLLRLGQSLAALKEKEAACATLGEIGRKYPRASVSVKQAAERERKKTGC